MHWWEPGHPPFVQQRSFHYWAFERHVDPRMRWYAGPEYPETGFRLDVNDSDVVRLIPSAG